MAADVIVGEKMKTFGPKFGGVAALDGTAVGATVGFAVGATVGFTVGATVGFAVGAGVVVGLAVAGECVGVALETGIGEAVGGADGCIVEDNEGVGVAEAPAFGVDRPTGLMPVPVQPASMKTTPRK
jgi:hypothetical protein